ncbi:MAG: sugar phosphate isomerase/epimerase family protein [Phycisphaeraceae bacterium]
MLIGAMNHPQADVIEQVEWMAATGLDFVDLTLEPPAAAPQRIDAAQVRAALAAHSMPAVGHTAYYLPIASPFEPVRAGAVAVLQSCIETFAAIGVAWMNVHPDVRAPMHDRAFLVQRNLQSLRELIEAGRQHGVGIMVENIPGSFNSADQLAELLEPLPDLGLHIDIGHCNLRTTENTTYELVERFGDRLRHVHLHDNKGGAADLHLPLGTGTVDYCAAVRALKASGYDATITLEVFSPESHHLVYSRDALRRAWDAA